MRRRGVRLLALGMLAAVVGFLWLAGDAANSIRATQSTPAAAVSPASGDPADAALDTSQPSPGLSAFRDAREPADAQDAADRIAAVLAAADEDDADDAKPKVPSLAAEAAREYRERARLPESTTAIADGVDPVESDQHVSRNSLGGPNGAQPLLTAYPSAVNYEAPDRVSIHAYFTDDGEPVAAEELVGTFIHELLGVVAESVLADDGQGADEIAGDLVYSASFAPPVERIRDYRGTYVATVRGRTVDLDERAVSTGFLYSVPGAHPTGRFRDELADGSLRVDVEIDVVDAGRFYVEGTLADASGQPLVWAQNAAELDRGKHWLALTFYGLAIRERGVDGPYVLRSLALSTVNEMPNQKNRVLANAHRTQRYSADDFTDVPFDDPDLIDAAERLENGGLGAPQAD